MTDSEEVEKVLQSLEGESGNFVATDGDPDKDKVEELLRQLEQEKEQGGDDAEPTNDRPKPVSRLPLKKLNGAKPAGDKPAVPKKSPPREEIPKPWKQKKGAFRKKPTEDENFFVVSTKEPPTLQETPQDDQPVVSPAPSSPPPTGNKEPISQVVSEAPLSPPIRAQASSSGTPNGAHAHVPLSSSPTPGSPSVPRSSSPQSEHAASPIVPRTISPTPHSTSATPPPASPPPPSVSPPPPSVSPTPPPASPTPPPATSPILSHAPPTLPPSTSPPPTITLTSPATPPPPQRSPKKETQPQTNSTDSPKQQRPAEDVLLDDSIKNEERVFSKQDFENLKNQILQQVSEETAILAQEFQELKLKYDEEMRGKAKLKSVLAEYEKTIAKLIDEAGMQGHHEGLAERVIELENETKRKTEEYEAIALAHSELKSRYEDIKTHNEKLKSNEQVQKEMISKLQNELQGSETRFHALKTHAETKLDSASEQLVKIRDERAKEMAVLQTKMQKAEARTQVLEKENKELLAICDDLMKQLEQKNNN